MVLVSHLTAKPSHYNQESEHYDAFNEKNSEPINQTIEKLLKKYKVKSVLDLTCGTGSQVFYLAKHGYEVVGADINSKMLTIAKKKTKKEKLDIPFLKGDMRSIQLGQFDAVITIFNAIGHLTKADFEKAIKNVHRNLKKGGIYIFDIFNLSYFMKDNNITKLTIDWQEILNGKKIRDIQYSTIDEKGILASYTLSFIQKGSQKSKISRSINTLQIYTAKQLKEMLERNGFKVLRQSDIDGSRFNENKTERILMIAKKN